MITPAVVKKQQDLLTEMKRQEQLKAVEPYEAYIDQELMAGKTTIVIDGTKTPSPNDLPLDFLERRYVIEGGWESVDAGIQRKDDGGSRWQDSPISTITLTFKMPAYRSSGYGQ